VLFPLCLQADGLRDGLPAPAQTPPACISRAGGGVADGPAVTFERIVGLATAIVEATVQSVTIDPPPTGPGSPIQRDHAVFLATRVIRGPDALGSFTTNQLHATGLFDMEPGKRFILFLTPADPRMPVPPERPDLPRYGLAAGARSTLCVAEGKVWVNRNGEFLRSRFDGVELEKAVAEIQASVKLQPVK
jgi:hypothetical protein